MPRDARGIGIGTRSSATVRALVKQYEARKITVHTCVRRVAVCAGRYRSELLYGRVVCT